MSIPRDFFPVRSVLYSNSMLPNPLINIVIDYMVDLQCLAHYCHGDTKYAKFYCQKKKIIELVNGEIRGIVKIYAFVLTKVQRKELTSQHKEKLIEAEYTEALSQIDKTDNLNHIEVLKIKAYVCLSKYVEEINKSDKMEDKLPLTFLKTAERFKKIDDLVGTIIKEVETECFIDKKYDLPFFAKDTHDYSNIILEITHISSYAYHIAWSQIENTFLNIYFTNCQNSFQSSVDFGNFLIAFYKRASVFHDRSFQDKTKDRKFIVFAKSLITAGADLNVVDSFGRSAAFIALRNDEQFILQDRHREEETKDLFGCKPYDSSDPLQIHINSLRILGNSK